jgi:hypothetical protein
MRKVPGGMSRSEPGYADRGRGPSRKIGATVLVAPISPCRCSRWLQDVPAQWVNGGKRQGVNIVMQLPLLASGGLLIRT